MRKLLLKSAGLSSPGRRFLIPVQTRVIYGAAGALLKISPALYRVLYGAYVKRTYGAIEHAASAGMLSSTGVAVFAFSKATEWFFNGI